MDILAYTNCELIPGNCLLHYKRKVEIMKKAIEMLLVEVRRMQDLSYRLLLQGMKERSAYRKREAERLMAIIRVMQKKT